MHIDQLARIRIGESRSSVAFTVLKSAVVAPIPSASVRPAMLENNGAPRSSRIAYRMSCASDSQVIITLVSRSERPHSAYQLDHKPCAVPVNILHLPTIAARPVAVASRQMAHCATDSTNGHCSAHSSANVRPSRWPSAHCNVTESAVNHRDAKDRGQIEAWSASLPGLFATVRDQRADVRQ